MYKTRPRHKIAYSHAGVLEKKQAPEPPIQWVIVLDAKAVCVQDYIHFYNYERIQLKTKLTPMEFRRQFV